MKKIKYFVRNYLENTFEIVNESNIEVFKGNISECEAWIRLKEGGYII